MLSIFSQSKKVLGLHITEDFVRYVCVKKSKKRNKLLSFGEERVPDLEPRNALLHTLTNIKNKTKIKDVVASLPEDIARFEIVAISKKVRGDLLLENIKFHLTEEEKFSFGEEVLFFEKVEVVGERAYFKVLISSTQNVVFFKTVFKNAGLNLVKFASHKDALLASTIKPSLLVPALVLNMEEGFTNVAIYYPFEDFEEITLRIEGANIPEALSEIYRNFYKQNGEKIGYVFASGSFAANNTFLNYLSHETRLPVDVANPLINYYFDSNEIPPITKKESLLYAVALGLGVV
jgi:Tfp pilus assembly PilM family ATPase